MAVRSVLTGAQEIRTAMEGMKLQVPEREERRCDGRKGVGMGAAGPIADFANWRNWR